ncbi:MAG: hypothetical protein K0V04_31710 [Deltaproteobacteria bacterium]|nr:hypothetical protein [Deltaproteobacteria bacterium]
MSYSAFDSGTTDIYMRRYDPTGVPISAPENLTNNGLGFSPALAAAAGCQGDFVLGWAPVQAPFEPIHQLFQADDDADGVADQCCTP